MKLLQILSVLAWVPVALVKLALIVVGLPAVYIKRRRSGPESMYDGLFRIEKKRPNTYWEAAIRNPVGGFGYLIDPPTEFATYGTHPIEPTKQNSRFAWRFRHRKLLSSIRLVWRYSSKYYGELYLGWKLGSEPHQLDFGLSLRPFATVGQ